MRSTSTPWRSISAAGSVRGWPRCETASTPSRRRGSGSSATAWATVSAGTRSRRRWTDRLERLRRLLPRETLHPMRVFFATDIHGSETCWRKFLNSAPHYKADVVILGGDMTGKALVPVVHDGGESWHGTLQEQRRDLSGEDEVSAFEQDVMRRGYYPFRTTPDELLELERDDGRLDALFREHMLRTVERWMDMASERLAGQGIRAFVCPGNDDQFEVDEILDAAPGVEPTEG